MLIVHTDCCNANASRRIPEKHRNANNLYRMVFWKWEYWDSIHWFATHCKVTTWTWFLSYRSWPESIVIIKMKISGSLSFIDSHWKVTGHSPIFGVFDVHIFSVDYLLPVQIDGEWVGIVFRNGFPAQALMDWYDITNKAILCDPAFDIERLSGFKNTHRRLRIKAENECNVEMTESVHSINESYRSSPASTPSAGPALSSLASETPSIAVNLSNESRLSSTSNTTNCSRSRVQNPSDSGFVFVDEDAYNSPNPPMDASTFVTCTCSPHFATVWYSKQVKQLVFDFAFFTSHHSMMASFLFVHNH